MPRSFRSSRLERVLDDVRAEAPSARVTESVAVSLMRRVSDLISPSRCVSWITSPGRIMSRLLAHVRKAAQFREVGDLELQAAEHVIQRVVAADRDGDEFEGALGVAVSRRRARHRTGTRQTGFGHGFWIWAPTAEKMAPATTQAAITPKRRGCKSTWANDHRLRLEGSRQQGIPSDLEARR